jgi:hypothetical protein
MFKNNLFLFKKREEFRQQSVKRFNFLRNKKNKRALNVHEALSFKREKTPIKK